MRYSAATILLSAVLLATISAGAANPANPTPPTAAVPQHPVVAGFERFYTDPSADRVRGGLLLLGELNCTSCHAAEPPSPNATNSNAPNSRAPGQVANPWILAKQAPLLGDVAGRADADYLRRFIAEPHAAKPFTTMPSMLDALPPDQRDATSDAIVHYLVSIRKTAFAVTAPDAAAVQRGEKSFHQSGCVACHTPRREYDENSEDELARTLLPLRALEKKYSIAGLAAFLVDPLAVRPSGRMPHVPLSPSEASDVANYLLKDTDAPVGLRYAYYEGDWSSLPDFDKLAPKQTGGANSFALGPNRRNERFALKFDGFINIARDGEYKFYTTSDDGSRLWIDGKLVVDNDGTHSSTTKDGKTRLTAGLHPIRVGYAQDNGEMVLRVEYEGPGVNRQPIPGSVLASTDKPMKGNQPLTVDPALAAKGKLLFASVGCASCHQLGPGHDTVAGQLIGKPLVQLAGTEGCVRDEPAKGRPRFHLHRTQSTAIAAAIDAVKAARLPEYTSAERIVHTMTAMNCYACHERDKRGGVPRSRFDRFTCDDKDLGDEGKIPPALTGIGDKLTDSWLAAVLTETAVARPYMHARMPQFGKSNVGHLTKDFVQTDRTNNAPAITTTDPRDVARKAGRDLVGKNGLSCISCHSFNRSKSLGIQTMDLAIMGQRLRPDWFHRYMLDPAVYRPGTRMPAAWPNGKSTRPTILGGDTDRQIDAVWAYLADGRRAKTPEGLGRQMMELIVGGEAVMYRNFIEGAGPRAIGVGYPEEVNLAFDANHLRLALIWQGRFIDASKHWSDRGAGFQGPLGDKIVKLHDGVPFAVLGATPDKTPWPAVASAQLKAPGFQFRGYRLDAMRRPTFQYTMTTPGGKVEIEDFPAGSEHGDLRSIVRTFTVAAIGPVEGLWYRAAAGGKIEPQNDGSFRVGDQLTLRFQLAGAAKPIVRNTGSAELLVPVVLDGGKARFVEEYRW